MCGLRIILLLHTLHPLFCCMDASLFLFFGTSIHTSFNILYENVFTLVYLHCSSTIASINDINTSIQWIYYSVSIINDIISINTSTQWIYYSVNIINDIISINTSTQWIYYSVNIINDIISINTSIQWIYYSVSIIIPINTSINGGTQ